MKEHDQVALACNLNGHKAGTIGTIVNVYDDTTFAVEFPNCIVETVIKHSLIPILRDEFSFEREMKCGQSEAQERIYKKIDDSSGRVWLIAKQPNEADNIYYHDPRDKGSQGFSGSTLAFRLEDGSVYEAKGPWHSNSDSLYKATGYDIRDKSAAQVAIGLEYRSGFMTIGKVIYLDEVPVIGKFDRDKDIALKFANQLNRPVMRLRKSASGSSLGWEFQDGWTREDLTQWLGK